MVWPNVTIIIDELINTIWDLIKDIIKWPAVMLAIRRTANVNGRIILLISSINTINIIRLNGVPEGTKWESIFFVLIIHPYKIKLIHNVKATGNVISIWLVDVKMNGNRPKELFNINTKNRGKNIITAKWELIDIFGFNSWLIFVDIILFIFEVILDIIQKEDGIKINGKIKTNQFKFEFIVEEGSKIENILIIIFSWIFY